MGAVIANPSGTSAREARFARYAWAVLVYNIGVVLWGAYVRATGSGAGCGGHWPLCNGDVVPRATRIETIIEYTHRLSSGVSIAAIAVLVIWAWVLFPKGHRARTAALFSVVFIVTEALLGAVLVLFGLVAGNTSLARGFTGALHLANTQILLAAITLTAWLATRPKADVRPTRMPRVLFAALALTVLVSMTGAVAALGDTLFPARSIHEGMAQDLSSASAFLLRLRVFHPLLAVGTAFFLLYAASVVVRQRPVIAVKRLALAVAALTVLQVLAGAINISLLAPLWMQMVHLVMADAVWIALVLLAAVSTASEPRERDWASVGA